MTSMDDPEPTAQDRPDTTRLLLVVLSAYVFEFVGYLAVTRAVPGWYELAAKPRWAPPDWSLNLVQIVVYILPATLLARIFGAKRRRLFLLAYLHLAAVAFCAVAVFALQSLPLAIAGCIAAIGFTAVFAASRGGLKQVGFIVPTLAWAIYLAAFQAALHR